MLLELVLEFLFGLSELLLQGQVRILVEQAETESDPISGKCAQVIIIEVYSVGCFAEALHGMQSSRP